MTLDHVLTREIGGTHEADNLVTCCLRCNSQKRDLPMRAWFAVLRDQGIDTARLSGKIRKHTARKIDMRLGKALLAARAA